MLWRRRQGAFRRGGKERTALGGHQHGAQIKPEAEATVVAGNENPAAPRRRNDIFSSKPARHTRELSRKQRREFWSVGGGPAGCSVGSLLGRFASGRAQRKRSTPGCRSPNSRSCLHTRQSSSRPLWRRLSRRRPLVEKIAEPRRPIARLALDTTGDAVPSGHESLAAGFFRPLQSDGTGLRAPHRNQPVRFVLNFETQT
jgi:hypothetical protein